MHRIITDFSRLNDAALLLFTEQVISSLTGNAAFPHPTPDLKTLNAALTRFRTDLAGAEEGGRTAVAQKNADKEALVQLLHKLANYVEFAADGDETKIASSGFHLARPRSSTPDLTAPANLTLEDGPNSGELLLTCDRVPQAISYLHQLTEDPLTPDSNWETKASTSRAYVFSGLQVGKRYWCRIGAVGVKEQTIYSNAVSRIVQ